MTLTPEALEEIKARAEAAEHDDKMFKGAFGGVSDADWVRVNKLLPLTSIQHMEASSPSNVIALIKALEDRDAEIKRLRPEVLSFAKLMEAALSAKDGVRGGNSWQKNTLALEILQHNLREKMDECEGKLKAAQCAANRGTEDGLFMADIETHRAADLAVHMGNFAMMIADICGALDRTAMDGGA